MKQHFRNCLYTKKSNLKLAGLAQAKDWVTKARHPLDNSNMCSDPYCNNQGLFECYVCDGPNNICKQNELGTLQACEADEMYCIKELSGE